MIKQKHGCICVHLRKVRDMIKPEIIQYLQKNKVVAGINESNVAAMCKKKIYEREVKIAVSETGEEGCAGHYEFFFETGKRNPQSGKMVQ